MGAIFSLADDSFPDCVLPKLVRPTGEHFLVPIDVLAGQGHRGFWPPDIQIHWRTHQRTHAKAFVGVSGTNLLDSGAALAPARSIPIRNNFTPWFCFFFFFCYWYFHVPFLNILLLAYHIIYWIIFFLFGNFMLWFLCFSASVILLIIVYIWVVLFKKRSFPFSFVVFLFLKSNIIFFHTCLT